MAEPSVAVRMLGDDGDLRLLTNVPDDVFDEPVDPDRAAGFLADPCHHMAVAVEGARLVGFASGVHHWHPDKAADLFINEVGVATAYQRQGIGRRLMATLVAHARQLGCRDAWVLTGSNNAAANALYAGAGGVADSDALVMYSFRDALAQAAQEPTDAA